MGLIEKLQAKLEIYRLEQKYTRRSKRTTFISDAQYVDGEYIYGGSGSAGSSASASASPTSPKSSTSWDRGIATAATGNKRASWLVTGSSWR